MSKIQLYTTSVTALWVYDYLLTLGDEVIVLYGGIGAERNLTTPYRSFTHGKWRTFSVRKPSSFFWDAIHQQNRNPL